MPPAVSAILSGFARPALWLPIALIVAAFALGGTSASHFLENSVIQLLAVLTVAAACAGLIGPHFSRDARFPLFLIVALISLMLLQLVPLPAAMWSSLEGRDFSHGVLNVLGVRVEHRALSMDPERTVYSMLALLPGIALAVTTMRLETRDRVVLSWLIVFGVFVSFALGVAQTSLGSEGVALTPYKSSHLGLPLGLLANANHQADLLLMGVLFAAALAPPLVFSGEGWHQKPVWIYGLVVAFAAGIVASGSRSGIALLAIALIAIALPNRVTRHARLLLGGGSVLILVVVLLVLFNPVFARSFSDFQNIEDPRFHFWPNVLWAIGHFGWLGTGAGTFNGVYRSVETLDSMTAGFVNHAHNEYLEIMLEMGIPGILLLLLFVGFVVYRAIHILRRRDLRAGRALAYAGLTGIVLMLIHSVVDYPLRTALLSTIFGFCCGLITTSPERDGDGVSLRGKEAA